LYLPAAGRFPPQRTFRVSDTAQRCSRSEHSVCFSLSSRVSGSPTGLLRKAGGPLAAGACALTTLVVAQGPEASLDVSNLS